MPDVLTVGEAMLTLSPLGAPLANADRFAAGVAGAESNVAAHLAALGHSPIFASRVGADPIGQRIISDLASRGVDTSYIVVDPTRPTGVMFKDPSPEGSTVHYFRRGSAASAMDAGFLPAPALSEVTVVHLSGVTPALSPTCVRLVDHLFADAQDRGIRVSFDVNYRPALWSVSAAAAALLPLARRADICFVGRDEAEAVWGTERADDIRALISEPDLLIVKDGAVGATAFQKSRAPVFVAAPAVEVAEPVGAGDAFAAGFLSGVLRGRSTAESLQSGHDRAALALTTLADLPERERAA
ncbi:sugar kinase [Microbacterium sp. RU33B]|uniref:sugar kinase n=1 Tax=Microbacterium sp. RU33B TaxID=1907390 RepID=UPI000966398B|nr:sugar kinase [Microbacterium sp. RU33B]SIT89767.1 2-dehydro-3-deoxygluconokinase [Microbacterium sp. RU33B]